MWFKTKTQISEEVFSLKRITMVSSNNDTGEIFFHDFRWKARRVIRRFLQTNAINRPEATSSGYNENKHKKIMYSQSGDLHKYLCKGLRLAPVSKPRLFVVTFIGFYESNLRKKRNTLIPINIITYQTDDDMTLGTTVSEETLDNFFKLLNEFNDSLPSSTARTKESFK